jgi:UDP-glucose 4-epimerase
MRALVTGGAGFIGSHLSERLLDLGYKVTVIDDLSTGGIENIVHAKRNPNFEYHIDTIFNRPLMAELVDRADVIFHLAAAVGVRRIVDFPVQTIETNVGGSEIVLEFAAKKQKRLLIASTSEVYGKANKIPFCETDDLIFGCTYNTRWSYACSKAIDEFLSLAYHREKKLPVTIVRLFNTSGPRQTGQYGMVLPTFVRQALRGEPLTVFGTGEQARCFTHIFDVMDAMIACVSTPKTVGEIFNLGNTEEVTITALATKIKIATGSSSPIQYVPYSEAYGPGFEDMQRRIPDISKAGEWFDYQPKRSLDEIISSVIEYEQEKIRESEPMASAFAR